MRRTIVVCAVLWCLAASLAWASSTPYEPPEGGDKWQKVTVALKGTDVDKDAQGNAVLACNIAETQHRIQLAAKNVEANGVYSVWLVKVDKKKVLRQTRVDDPDRPLKADKHSKLAFASNLDACPQGKYTHVEVRYHEDGDAKNIRGAKTALSGKIP